VVFLQLEQQGARWNLMTIPLDHSSPPALLVRGNPLTGGGHVSPDGVYLAYMSNESGHWEVYLTRFPSGEGRWQVSNQGGTFPHWNAKGDRLYFGRGDDIMEVEVSLGAAPVLGTPHRVLTRPSSAPQPFGWDPPFDLNGDGTRFLTTRNASAMRRSPGVAIVQNWFEEFHARR